MSGGLGTPLAVNRLNHRSVMRCCSARHAELFLLPQGYGVYRFQDKYGANVDGYSPIYTPDVWSESGDTYKLGVKGLTAW